jgi:DNA-binding transcriptional regulator YhcF (GntR family)
MTKALEKASIVIASNWKNKGYVAISNKILYSNLSIQAKALYWYLLSRCFQKNNCFPSYEKMGRDLKIHPDTVIKYRKELENAGLIVHKRRGRGKTNVYILRF